MKGVVQNAFSSLKKKAKRAVEGPPSNSHFFVNNEKPEVYIDEVEFANK